MPSLPPEFESVQDRLAREKSETAWSASLQEQQAKAARQDATVKHAQLRRFMIDRGFKKGALVLMNIVTGQAAAAFEVEHGGSTHTLSRSESRLRKWSPYARIRAKEAAGLLAEGRVLLEDAPRHGFEIYLSDETYPAWLFVPTDEARADWKPAADEFRRRARWARLKEAFIPSSMRVGPLLIAVVAGLTVGLLAYMGFITMFYGELLRAFGL